MKKFICVLGFLLSNFFGDSIEAQIREFQLFDLYVAGTDSAGISTDLGLIGPNVISITHSGNNLIIYYQDNSATQDKHTDTISIASGGTADGVINNVVFDPTTKIMTLITSTGSMFMANLSPFQNAADVVASIGIEINSKIEEWALMGNTDKIPSEKLPTPIEMLDGVVTDGTVTGTTLTLSRSQGLDNVVITGLPQAGEATNDGVVTGGELTNQVLTLERSETLDDITISGFPEMVIILEARDPTKNDYDNHYLFYDGLNLKRVIRVITAMHQQESTFSTTVSINQFGIGVYDSRQHAEAFGTPTNGQRYYSRAAAHWEIWQGSGGYWDTRQSVAAPRDAQGSLWIGEWIDEDEAKAHVTRVGEIATWHDPVDNSFSLYRVSSITPASTDYRYELDPVFSNVSLSDIVASAVGRSGANAGTSLNSSRGDHKHQLSQDFLDEIDDLNVGINDNEGDLTSLIGEVGSLQTDVNLLEGTTGTLTNEVSDLTTDVDNLENLSSTLATTDLGNVDDDLTDDEKNIVKTKLGIIDPVPPITRTTVANFRETAGRDVLNIYGSPSFIGNEELGYITDGEVSIVTIRAVSLGIRFSDDVIGWSTFEEPLEHSIGGEIHPAFSSGLGLRSIFEIDANGHVTFEISINNSGTLASVSELEFLYRPLNSENDFSSLSLDTKTTGLTATIFSISLSSTAFRPDRNYEMKLRSSGGNVDLNLHSGDHVTTIVDRSKLDEEISELHSQLSEDLNTIIDDLEAVSKSNLTYGINTEAINFDANQFSKWLGNVYTARTDMVIFNARSWPAWWCYQGAMTACIWDYYPKLFLVTIENDGSIHPMGNILDGEIKGPLQSSTWKEFFHVRQSIGGGSERLDVRFENGLRVPAGSSFALGFFIEGGDIPSGRLRWEVGIDENSHLYTEDYPFENIRYAARFSSDVDDLTSTDDIFADDTTATFWEINYEVLSTGNLRIDQDGTEEYFGHPHINFTGTGVSVSGNDITITSGSGGVSDGVISSLDFTYLENTGDVLLSAGRTVGGDVQDEFRIPGASFTNRGIVELANITETMSGFSSALAVTPSGLNSMITSSELSLEDSESSSQAASREAIVNLVKEAINIAVDSVLALGVAGYSYEILYEDSANVDYPNSTDWFNLEVADTLTLGDDRYRLELGLKSDNSTWWSWCNMPVDRFKILGFNTEETTQPQPHDFVVNSFGCKFPRGNDTTLERFSHTTVWLSRYDVDTWRIGSPHLYTFDRILLRLVK